MPLITLDNISLRFSEKVILDEINATIKKGEKIAQITLLEHKSYLFNINTDAERDGGFGSTGQ